MGSKNLCSPKRFKTDTLPYIQISFILSLFLVLLTMLEVQSLSKKYDSQFVVKEVSFNVEKGKVLVLLGTSGCGKTTTLKMINRLAKPTTGRVLIKGKDTRTIPAHQLRRKIGYVIQEIGLFPHYNVAKNIRVVPDLLGWPDQRAQSRVYELLELLGLPNRYARMMPDELSGGQRQRVGLARALAADPDLILLDEPFGALDPITRKDIQKEFMDLEGVLNKAIVLVTHDVMEAVKLGDELCLMDKGVIQQIGTPRKLLFNPANDFVRDFFSANRIEIEPALISIGELLPWMDEGGDGTEVAHELTLFDIVSRYKPTEKLAVKNSGKINSIVVDQILGVFYQNRDKIIAP